MSGNYQWRPAEVLTRANRRHVCMVLNVPIEIPPCTVQFLWENAFLRCTVDGGTNRWQHFQQTHCRGKCMKLPDVITGDFDSISEEARNYFQDPAITWVHTPDQNETDFTKAVRVVQPLIAEKINDIIVFNDTSGRLDQIMANINTLYKFKDTAMNLYLLSSNSITWLLPPGKHSIQIPKDIVEAQRWCALIPVGSRADNVTTKGLKWNLNNGTLEFGNLVSTSNTYASTDVQIATDTCLLWSMGIFASDD